MAYYKLEPFGPAPQNLNTGIMASMIYNANRTKQMRAISPQEISLGHWEKSKQSTDEMMERAEHIVSVFGGKKVKRKKRRRVIDNHVWVKKGE